MIKRARIRGYSVIDLSNGGYGASRSQSQPERKKVTRLIHTTVDRLSATCHGVNTVTTPPSETENPDMHAFFARTTLVVFLVLLGGCSSAPRPQLVTDIPTTEGCQIRAGQALPEGDVNAGFGGVQVAAAGASVTALGTCPEKLHVFVRAPGGGWVCYGTSEVCTAAIGSAPVTVPAAEFADLQRRALANDERVAP